MSDSDTQLILKRIDALEKRFNVLQRTVDIKNGDIDEDRKNLSEMAVRMATFEAHLKEIRDTLATQATRLTQRVIDGVQDAIDEAPNEISKAILTEANKKNGKGKKLKWKLFNRILGIK